MRTLWKAYLLYVYMWNTRYKVKLVPKGGKKTFCFNHLSPIPRCAYVYKKPVPYLMKYIDLAKGKEFIKVSSFCMAF